ncbi:acyl-CoA thioester hydrolase [Williamsia limnetica]|uniref:Acyl-CoA thioester hydrolase n=1 Tax=Williamsia limnetica TaxID=882452 RepID=A0A318RHC3_WILLI|nr:thioesterase family protein [Williamsia limnetica]PYE16457.1 acyl-CoA thioester hydrolase [Williamsia limnetica]
MTDPSWSATVRYAEADQQGVVFNAHYLLYCDEAMGAFCSQHDILEFAELVRLKTSTLTWHAPARWGDVIDVYTSVTGLGRTSITVKFDLRVGERSCCTVDTVYVYADVAGQPQPIPDTVRQVLL